MIFSTASGCRRRSFPLHSCRRDLRGFGLGPTLQFSLHRLPNQVGTLFAVVESRVDALKRAGRETSGGLFFIYAFSSHGYENK